MFFSARSKMYVALLAALFVLFGTGCGPEGTTKSKSAVKNDEDVGAVSDSNSQDNIDGKASKVVKADDVTPEESKDEAGRNLEEANKPTLDKDSLASLEAAISEAKKHEIDTSEAEERLEQLTTLEGEVSEVESRANAFLEKDPNDGASFVQEVDASDDGEAILADITSVIKNCLDAGIPESEKRIVDLEKLKDAVEERLEKSVESSSESYDDSGPTAEELKQEEQRRQKEAEDKEIRQRQKDAKKFLEDNLLALHQNKAREQRHKAAKKYLDDNLLALHQNKARDASRQKSQPFEQPVGSADAEAQRAFGMQQDGIEEWYTAEIDVIEQWALTERAQYQGESKAHRLRRARVKQEAVEKVKKLERAKERKLHDIEARRTRRVMQKRDSLYSDKCTVDRQRSRERLRNSLTGNNLAAAIAFKAADAEDQKNNSIDKHTVTVASFIANHAKQYLRPHAQQPVKTQAINQSGNNNNFDGTAYEITELFAEDTKLMRQYWAKHWRNEDGDADAVYNQFVDGLKRDFAAGDAAKGGKSGEAPIFWKHENDGGPGLVVKIFHKRSSGALNEIDLTRNLLTQGTHKSLGAQLDQLDQDRTSLLTPYLTVHKVQLLRRGKKAAVADSRMVITMPNVSDAPDALTFSFPVLNSLTEERAVQLLQHIETGLNGNPVADLKGVPVRGARWGKDGIGDVSEGNVDANFVRMINSDQVRGLRPPALLKEGRHNPATGSPQKRAQEVLSKNFAEPTLILDEYSRDGNFGFLANTDFDRFGGMLAPDVHWLEKKGLTDYSLILKFFREGTEIKFKAVIIDFSMRWEPGLFGVKPSSVFARRAHAFFQAPTNQPAPDYAKTFFDGITFYFNGPNQGP